MLGTATLANFRILVEVLVLRVEYEIHSWDTVLMCRAFLFF